MAYGLIWLDNVSRIPPVTSGPWPVMVHITNLVFYLAIFCFNLSNIFNVGLSTIYLSFP